MLKRVFFLLSAVLIFSSCNDKSKIESLRVQVLNETIENSNKWLEQSIEEILLSLKAKIHEPGTARIAQALYPKTEKIQSLANTVKDFIGNLKIVIDEQSVSEAFQGIGSRLYDTIMSYKESVFSIDSQIAHTFRKSFIAFASSFDSSGKNQNDLYNHFFKDASPVFAKAILNRFQNNIQSNAQKMIVFCHERMAIDHVIRDHVPTWPFAVQSSKVVGPNEIIEITAGVASFNTLRNQKVFINEKIIPIKGDVSVYKLKTPSKPGRYSINLKINYTDDDGRHQSMQKEIEYTVAKIQKQ